MPALSLTLCGRVALTIGGLEPPGSPLGTKDLGLLAYLALEPGPHSRDELAALLWSECPDEKAKASLRQSLTHLRHAIGDAVRADRTSVELTAPVDTDVGVFARLAEELPDRAAAIDVSRFLEGIRPRRSPAFEEWADLRRAALLRTYREALAAATRSALATHRWADATGYAKQWVTSDPLSSAANAALMEGHFLGGERTLASEVFETYRARLARETGGKPDRRVLEMLSRIEGSAATPRGRRATGEWHASAPSFDGILVGREEAWEALAQAWRDVRAGRGRIVLVEGEPGVGKTRLAADFLRWVTSNGGAVLRGRGYDARGGVPFGAVMEALRSGIGVPGLAGTDPQWLAEVSRVVPELRDRFPSLPETGPSSAADGWRLFEGIAQLLLALADEAPTAVLIDDLHWCDADSCALLHFLVRRLDGARVLWCLAFSPGAAERDAPSVRLARALRAHSGSVVVPLSPLAADDVWKLIRSLGPATAPELARRLADHLHGATAGYPFYVVELLKTLFAQGWLAVDLAAGAWTVTAEGPDDLPPLTVAPTVHDAIADRIECLAEELRMVLITIAVAPRGCRTDVLSHVHGISRLRAAAAGDALVERHLAVEEDEVYRCAHPVIARVVRDRLGSSRRREVHRSLALALELAAAAHLSASDAGEIALHAEQAGERAMAYRYALLAAAACERRYAFEDALGWLDLAAAQAATPAEADEANRATDRLLDRAERHDRPAATAGGTTPPAAERLVTAHHTPAPDPILASPTGRASPD